MTFQVPRPIFTLTIRLIDGLAVDMGTRRTSTLVVRVDIINMNDEARISDICGEGRIEMMLRGNPVQPNRCVADTDFAMDRATVGSSMNASRNEPKCLH